MFLVYKIVNHGMIFLSENLEFIGQGEWLKKSLIEDDLMFNILNRCGGDKYKDLTIVTGWCFIMRDIIDGVAEAEYLVINSLFEFDNQRKKRYDIISLLRERKIDSIIN